MRPGVPSGSRQRGRQLDPPVEVLHERLGVTSQDVGLRPASGVVWAGLAATDAAAVCADPGAPFASGFQGAPNGRGMRVNNPGMTRSSTGLSAVGSRRSSCTTPRARGGWWRSTGSRTGTTTTVASPQRPARPRSSRTGSSTPPRGCLTTPTTLSGGSQHNFSIQDENQNGVWDYRRNTNVIFSSANLSPFVTGLPWNNGERLTNPAGTPHAVFNGMKRWGPTSSGALGRALFNTSRVTRELMDVRTP